MKRLLVVVIVMIFMASCDQGQPKNPIVATVGNVSITQKDVQNELDNLPPLVKEFFKGQEGATKLVDEIVKRELLYLEGKKQGIDKDKDLEKKLEDFKKMYVINKLLEKEIGQKTQVTFSDKEIQDYYNTHKSEFKGMKFEDAKNSINQKMTTEKQKEIFNQFIEGIKKNIKVEINKDEIAKLPFAQNTPQEQILPPLNTEAQGQGKSKEQKSTPVEQQKSQTKEPLKK